MKTPRMIWRWAEQDFGFRFQQGKGKQAAHYYQAAQWPSSIMSPPHIENSPRVGWRTPHRLQPPRPPQIVAIPWKNYSDPDLQMISEPGGICLNWGWLPQPGRGEPAQKPTGVNRAKEFVADLAMRPSRCHDTEPDPAHPHRDVRGHYPWAGKWRTVTLSKGDVSCLPRYGWEPVLAEFERERLALTPFIRQTTEGV